MAPGRTSLLLTQFIILIILEITNGFTQKFQEVLRGKYDLKDAMRQQLGGKFQIGINDPHSDTGEYPPRIVEVKPFYMDIYPVTVAQFLSYKIKKPKYKTTANNAGYSFVFSNVVPPNIKTKWASEAADSWWLAVRGAQWDRPEGPGTNITDRLDYPVVHVSYMDAKAYCMWAGKRLPTEEEWEYAARGQLKGVQYPWGDKFQRGRMNYFQGRFPNNDKGTDGWIGLSPVNAFGAQNNHSGMFDMLGNVWEWTSTRYYVRVVDRKSQALKYVLKGGSYLDSRDGTFNHVVRTANRMGMVPHYTAHNVGFRCAASAPHLVQKMRRSDPRFKPPAETSTRRPPKLHKRRDDPRTKKYIKVEL
ncbi:Inactive C-alpha-formylglycine-proteinrating enzyme 2 [Mactra antiquata]